MLIFDRDGNLQDSWGNGSFLFAHGFYIEDDVVYVTDRDASTCLVYTLDGKPVQMLGRHGRHSDTGCEVAGGPGAPRRRAVQLPRRAGALAVR